MLIPVNAQMETVLAASQVVKKKNKSTSAPAFAIFVHQGGSFTTKQVSKGTFSPLFPDTFI